MDEWLIIRSGVVLTPIIEPVIEALKPWFERQEVRAWVTSGLRDPSSQLRIIRNLAIEKGIDQEFSAIKSCKIDDVIDFGGRTVRAWQPAWSRLLNLSVLVNPPVPAEALFDQHRDGVLYAKAGRIIGPSPHFAGTAFDIGGGEGGIKEELPVVRDAFMSGTIAGMKGFKAEHNNNAIHIDCTDLA